MAPAEEHLEFGSVVHIEQALELDDEVEGVDEEASGLYHDDEVTDDDDAEARRRRAGQLHPAGRKSVHKQDATIQMVKWTSAAITTRKKVLKEVDENEPAGLDWFEEDYLKNLLTIQEFEHKFVVLARRWRRFMNFYGLIEDVSLLLVDAKGACNSVRSTDEQRPGRVNFMAASYQRQRRAHVWRESLEKLSWLLMIAGANLVTIYMLIAHFAWELHRLDATISTAVASVNESASTNQTLPGQAGGPVGPVKQVVAVVVVAGNPQLATFNGWSILRDFLENLRRHLSRFFALVLIFIWHKNCHKFELLFVDCRRYYAAFYPKLSSLGMSELWTTHGPVAVAPATTTTTTVTSHYGGEREASMESGNRKVNERAVAVRKIKVILTIREHQLQLIEATSRFYKLAWKRIAFAVWFPFAHLVFNIVGIFLAPNALIIANNGQQPAPSSLRSPMATSSAGSANDSLSAASITNQLLQNFETFHLAVHTAFHPYEHQINDSHSASQQQPQLAPGWSAFYCLAELFVHYIFINGPRIVCATCLSLVLSIHQQCLRAFNKHLTKLIRRGRKSPLSRWDMVKLLKQYDMIGMMHERIESTFKWSLVSWFTLMFISCLMLIFTLTESTTAAFGSATDTPTSSKPISAPDILETVCPVAIMLARIFFVCYAPILIYAESFKIESESSRATQLIMLLARRQDDPVAQAIEPGLFGPIQLSAGGFFRLSKRSVAPLLGAIVTFSIMFIGSSEGHHHQQQQQLASAKRPWTSARWPDDGRQHEVVEDEEEESDEEPEEDQDEDEDGLEQAEELPDDAATQLPSARPSPQQARRYETAAQFDRETTRLMGGGGQRKPPGLGLGRGRQAKISLSAGGGGGGGDESQHKMRQWRKYKQLNRAIESPNRSQGAAISSQHATSLSTSPSRTGNQVERDIETNGLDAEGSHLTRPMRPKLAPFYLARLRENERQLSFAPKLKVENQIEICDFELLARHHSAGPTGRRPGETNATKTPPVAAGGLFAVTWIDRVSGEIAIEATNLTLINCERQRNYTLGMRAIACNGLESNEATLLIELEDVNEFSPEFERSQYSVSVDALELRAKQQYVNENDSESEDQEQLAAAAADSQQSAALTSTSWCHLITVRAHDQDCSPELGQVCRYELVGGGGGGGSPDTRHPESGGETGGLQMQQQQTNANSNVRVDARGNLKARCKWLLNQVDNNNAGEMTSSSFMFQVVAFDCGGKKSQRPASVLLDIRHHHAAQQPHQQQANPHGLKQETLNETTRGTDQAPCRPGWKDVDTQIAYKPASGEHWPFLRAKLDLCSIKCHRPLNITVKLQLEATPPSGSESTIGGGSSKPSSIRPRRHSLPPTPVFHCDRDPYAMVSKRRLCGARRKTLELLPPLSAHTRWIGPLVWGTTRGGGGGATTTAGRGPRRRQQRPKVAITTSSPASASASAAKVQVFAPVQANLSESNDGETALQADELPLNLDDEEEGEEEQEEQDVGEAHGEEDHAAEPGRSAASEDEENLGAYLPDGSYGQLAREFAAHELHSTANIGHGGGDDRKQQHRQHRQTRRTNEPGAEHLRLRKSAIYRDQVYHFDGVNDALLVPSFVYSQGNDQRQKHHLDSLSSANKTNAILFGLKHTLSFWMRHSEFKFTQQQQRRQRRTNESEHEDELLELSRHVREHLLCVSERRHQPHRHQLPVSNRHRYEPSKYHSKHYAIYMKNCKLNLLMKRQPRGEENQLDEEEPHEWRWSLDQTGQFCDNKWHMYTINVNYPLVELYVDGQQFDMEKKIAPVASNLRAQVETYPRDQVASSTVLTLGACWDARLRSMVGHFRGALSGLNVLENANDEAASIECLGRCAESLVSSAPQNDQQRAPPPVQPQDNSLVAFQEAQDRIQLRGHDQLDLEDALAQIAYVNWRQLPSIGGRTINVETSLSCHLSSGGATSPGQVTPAIQTIPVDPLRVDINVLPSTSLPVISLTGTPNIAREHLPFIEGRVAPFESIKLQVKQVSLLLSGSSSTTTAKQSQVAASAARMTLKSNQQLTADLLDYIDDATLNLHPQRSPTGSPTTSGGVSLESSENLVNSAPGGRIESCRIQASPSLDESHESLILPLAQIQRLDLYWRQSSSGAVIYGLDSAQNYESLLRMITYRNERPSAHEERHFLLTCSDMSGRLLSNEHHQKLTMIHPRPVATGGGDTRQSLAPQVTRDDDHSFVTATTNETNYFSSLRHSAGPHLIIGASGEQVALVQPSQQQPSAASNKLDRVAMAFLVFVVSLILIVLVIALTNLRETTESASERAAERRNKRAACHRRSRPAVLMSERLNSVRGVPSYRCADKRELLSVARADCYFAHDELTDEHESYTSSGEEFEEDELVERERIDTFDEDDARSYDEQMYDFDVRSANLKSGRRECTGPMPPVDELDSLSWDDELNTCSRRHHHNCHKSPAASTTIVINPLAQGTGTSNTLVARRTLVASLKQGTKPQSHLAIKPAKPGDDDDDEERASLISADEADESGAEESIRTMDAHSMLAFDDEDEDDDLLAIDEDMTSLCSQSRSCSISSLASGHGAETTMGGGPGAPLELSDIEHEQYRQARYHSYHDHFQHNQPARHTCRSALMAHRSCARYEQVEEQQRQPAYEICHRHHHRCLREVAPAHLANECTSSTMAGDSDNETIAASALAHAPPSTVSFNHPAR